MSSSRVLVEMSQDLVDSIDALVGAGSRSSFIMAAAEEELRRRRLRAFLTSDEPAWKDEDHPDIVAVGTAAWVRNRRQADEALRRARLDQHEAKFKEAV